MRAIICGLVLGVVLGASGVAVASWLVHGEGKAGGAIGSLRPLEVTLAKGAGTSLPGELLELRAVVENPNDIPLSVTSVELVDDLEVEGKSGCNASLKGVRGLSKTDGLILKPGENTITVGAVRLPKQLDQDCAGGAVTAKIRVTAAFGAAA
jgi:hypothetical protein